MQIALTPPHPLSPPPQGDESLRISESPFVGSDSPRPVLTAVTSPGVFPGDNAEYDLIITQGMRIDTYEVISMLGDGTFGQVVCCRDLVSKGLVALKVVKSEPAYCRQGMLEAAFLHLVSVWDVPNTVRARRHFLFRGHICIVFELLSMTVYKHLETCRRGMGLSQARRVLVQLLRSLAGLLTAGIIHCDVKPENMMYADARCAELKLIDLGSACFVGERLQPCVQSLFYRAPEVILGLPYGPEIDMWSVGCIAVELLLGIPLFPGNSEYDQLLRIVEIVGFPPTSVLDAAPYTRRFFHKRPRTASGIKRTVYTLKTREEFEAATGEAVPPHVRYHAFKSLTDVCQSIPLPVVPGDAPRKPEFRAALADFLTRTLAWDPAARLRPDQALAHPFLTKAPFPGRRYVPPPSEMIVAPIERADTESLLDLLADGDAAVLRHAYTNDEYYGVFKRALDSYLVLDTRDAHPFTTPAMIPHLPLPVNRTLPCPSPPLAKGQEEQESPRCLVPTLVPVSRCKEPAVLSAATPHTTHIQRVKTVDEVRKVALQVSKKALKASPHPAPDVHVPRRPNYLSKSTLQRPAAPQQAGAVLTPPFRPSRAPAAQPIHL